MEYLSWTFRRGVARFPSAPPLTLVPRSVTDAQEARAVTAPTLRTPGRARFRRRRLSRPTTAQTAQSFSWKVVEGRYSYKKSLDAL